MPKTTQDAARPGIGATEPTASKPATTEQTAAKQTANRQDARSAVPIPVPALVLGLGGLLPFAITAVLMWSLRGPSSFLAELAMLAYGAVILSFLGGVRWGNAMAQGLAGNWAPMIFSILPSLLAWVALLQNSNYSVLLLLTGFVMQYLYDRHAVANSLLPAWYGRLRTMLTVGVLLCLLAGLMAIILVL